METYIVRWIIGYDTDRNGRRVEERFHAASDDAAKTEAKQRFERSGRQYTRDYELLKLMVTI